MKAPRFPAFARGALTGMLLFLCLLALLLLAGDLSSSRFLYVDF